MNTKAEQNGSPAGPITQDDSVSKLGSHITKVFDKESMLDFIENSLKVISTSTCTDPTHEAAKPTLCADLWRMREIVLGVD